jgi:hypothetical protein
VLEHAEERRDEAALYSREILHRSRTNLATAPSDSNLWRPQDFSGQSPSGPLIHQVSYCGSAGLLAARAVVDSPQLSQHCHLERIGRGRPLRPARKQQVRASLLPEPHFHAATGAGGRRAKALKCGDWVWGMTPRPSSVEHHALRSRCRGSWARSEALRGKDKRDERARVLPRAPAEVYPVARSSGPSARRATARARSGITPLPAVLRPVPAALNLNARRWGSDARTGAATARSDSTSNTSAPARARSAPRCPHGPASSASNN